MSTYRKIHGRSIQAVTTDPSETVAEGQVWYNTTSDTFKTVVALEAWRSSAPYPRQADHTAGSGTQTAALSCSDNIPSPSAEITSTFEYNGSGWSAGGSMNTERGDGTNNMTGSQTASFYVGGRPNAGPPTPFGSTATEEYDGSSWTSGGAYPAGLRGANAFGILTAGVNAGGNSASPSVSTNVNNEYNGTAWTSGNNNTLGRFNCSSSGTSTAGILVAGFSNPPPVINSVTEEYDGSSWTSGGSLPEARNGLGGSGTQTANIVFGGASPPGTKTTTTSKYDGTSWTTSPATLATGREKFGSAKGASQTSTLAWCGNTPTDVTEEYDSSANVITAAAWSSAPSIATGRYLLGSAGSTYNATVVFGGVTNPGSTYRAQTEEYNGTSWSEDGDMGTARFLPAKTIGTATAALAAGGYNGSTLSNSEQYNGSSWTAETAMPAANRNQSGFGIETAGVVAGGQGPAIWANVYKYDGSSWTTANALPVAKEQMCGTGTETAGLVVCGRPPSGNVTTVEEFDGTNWASGGAHPTAHAGNIVAGTQTDAYQFTGYDNSPAPFGITASYDGTSWRTMPSLGTNISSSGGSTGQGSGSSQIQGGGSTPSTPSSTTSQEFNTETTAVNVKTLTQS